VGSVKDLHLLRVASRREVAKDQTLGVMRERRVRGDDMIDDFRLPCSGRVPRFQNLVVVEGACPSHEDALATRTRSIAPTHAFSAFLQWIAP